MAGVAWVGLVFALACGGSGSEPVDVDGSTALASAPPDAPLFRAGPHGSFRYVDATGATVLAGPFAAGPSRTVGAVFWARQGDDLVRIDRAASPPAVGAVSTDGPSEDLGDGFALARRADKRWFLHGPDGATRTQDGMGIPTAVWTDPAVEGSVQWPLAACDDVDATKCGFLGTDGAWVVAPTGWVWPFRGGLGLVERDGAVSYVDASGATALGPYEMAYPFSSDGFALIEVGRTSDYDAENQIDGPLIGATRVIDRTGREIADLGRTVEPGHDALGLDRGRFHDGLARLWHIDTGGFGFVDTSGRWVVPPTPLDQPDHAPYAFSEGLAAVWGDGGFGFVDTTGAVVIPHQFPVPGHDLASALTFSEGKAPVPVDGGWAYVDRTGAIAIPGPFTPAGAFRDGRAEVGVGGGTAWIDATGRIVGGS